MGFSTDWILMMKIKQSGGPKFMTGLVLVMIQHVGIDQAPAGHNLSDHEEDCDDKERGEAAYDESHQAGLSGNLEDVSRVEKVAGHVDIGGHLVPCG